MLAALIRFSFHPPLGFHPSCFLKQPERLAKSVSGRDPVVPSGRVSVDPAVSAWVTSGASERGQSAASEGRADKARGGPAELLRQIETVIVQI